MPRPQLFLIDTLGFLFRAFHPRARSTSRTTSRPSLRAKARRCASRNSPPELLQQIPMARRAPEGQRISTLAFPGYEADDVIGALSHRAVDNVVIVSGRPVPAGAAQALQRPAPAEDGTVFPKRADSWFRRKEENEY